MFLGSRAIFSGDAYLSYKTSRVYILKTLKVSSLQGIYTLRICAVRIYYLYNLYKARFTQSVSSSIQFEQYEIF